MQNDALLTKTLLIIKCMKPPYRPGCKMINVRSTNFSNRHLELNENKKKIKTNKYINKHRISLSAFDMEMIFHSHANESHFHKKGCALGLMILKVRIFGTRLGLS